ncbi:MAG: hypothetical protein B6D55_02480 [Candidatus Omnitrophica bacterium 4484_70.2]|nr:MAG: hypothetical protein B6D55_02480 [Candidatus Omnitrophica bacterium 4484_70.2]
MYVGKGRGGAMRSFKFVWWAFTGLIVGVVSFSGLSFAQEKALKLGEVVVTATKQERLAKDTPAAVTVITSEDIEKSGASTVAEVLKGVPGVTVYDLYGVSSDVVLRGNYHAGHSYGYTLILVDGMPQVSPDTGKAYWDMIPLSNIERIEVVMGPGSALWGGNAVGGTINIITKKPSEEPIAQIATKFGEYGMRHHSFYGQIMGDEGWTEDLSIAVSVESKEADGWRYNSSYDNENYWLKVNKDIKDWGANVGLTVSRSDKYTRSPGKISQAMWDANELTSPYKEYYKHTYGDYDVDYQRLVFKKGIGESQRLKLNFYNYAKDYEIFHGPSLFYFTDTNAKGGGLLYELSFGLHSLILGIDLELSDIAQDVVYKDSCYRPDWTSLKSRRNTSTDIEKYAFYLQDSWKVSQPLEVIFGVRWDKAEFDNRGWKYNSKGTVKTDISGKTDVDGWSPKGSLIYKLNESLNVYGSIGRAFKIPDPYKLYVSSYVNPNLNPEKATTYEIGTKYTLPNLAASLSFYISEVEDLIVLNDTKDQYENIGETEHKGIEGAVTYLIMEGLVANLNADYTRAEVKKNPSKTSIEGKYLHKVPKWKVSLGLDYTHPCGFFASFVGRRIGKWYMDDMNERTYSGYFVVDAKLGYKKDFGKSEVEWSVGGNNIFDKKYAAKAYTSYGKNYYYPGMPRYFFSEVKIKF